MNIRFLVFLQLRYQEVKQSLRALQEGAFTGEEKEELVHGAALGQWLEEAALRKTRITLTRLPVRFYGQVQKFSSGCFAGFPSYRKSFSQ